MRIQGVDLPDTLLDAQKNGSLVIFAGAGVSIPAPSNYPNFDKLAEDVAQRVLAREDREPVDRFLGRLAAHGVLVHEVVCRILSDPNSSPKPLHSNLLRLFESALTMKLVTTNFDVHVTTATRSLFEVDVAFEIYSAPALPLGDVFTGLVHLHGSVDKPPGAARTDGCRFWKSVLKEPLEKAARPSFS
jgi:NAD-dependent SIR2 family protein deacetylase